MANATTHNDNPDTWLRFPPFPTAPPGETLISFKDFKPSGFPIASHDAEPDQVKLDGTGRPTVTLRVKHSLTSEEQSKSKRRKKKRTIVTETGGTRTLMWYEQWAEDEISKTCHVNPYAQFLLPVQTPLALSDGLPVC